MPDYHFDIFNADSDLVDAGSQELADDEVARRLALRTLAELAHRDIGSGGDSRITVRMRLRGTLIYSTTVTMIEHWIRLDS